MNDRRPNTLVLAKINSHGWYHYAALLGFVLIVPGFALYQLALFKSVISPFLGGYLGIIGFIVFLGMLPVFLVFSLFSSGKLCTQDWIFLIFSLIYFLVSSYFSVGSFRSENSISKLTALPMIVSCYFVFRLIDFKSYLWIIVSRITFAICIISIYIVTEQAAEVTRYIDENNIDDYANYQMHAMILLFSSISMIPSIRNIFVRLIIYALTIWVFFINGARSEFIVFILSGLCIELFVNRSWILLTAFTGLIAGLLLTAISTFFTGQSQDNRIANLFISGSSDASVIDRSFALSGAIENIKSSPLFGDFSNHEFGFYTHNLLSVWSDFGIFVFVLFVAGLVIAFRESVRAYVSRQIKPELAIMAGMAISGIMLFVFAKAYFHPILGVMMGLSARYGDFSANPFSHEKSA